MRRPSRWSLGASLLALIPAGCGSSGPAPAPASIPSNDPGIEAMKAEMLKSMKTKTYVNKTQPGR